MCAFQKYDFGRSNAQHDKARKFNFKSEKHSESKLTTNVIFCAVCKQTEEAVPEPANDTSAPVPSTEEDDKLEEHALEEEHTALLEESAAEENTAMLEESAAVEGNAAMLEESAAVEENTDMLEESAAAEETSESVEVSIIFILARRAFPQ